VSVFEEGRFVRMLGAGPGEFLKPNGIAVTSNQFSYVVDSGAHMVKMYAPDGSLHRTWGTRGWGDGQLDFPTDIAFDEVSGELFITELDNRRISVFSRDGDWLRSMYPPVNDQGDPVFYRIAGLGVGPSGNLYVVDSALATVSILTPDGALVETIGYQGGSYWTGDLKVPVDAATDGNLLFVTSSKDRLVKVFGATE
jgi:DNA-binding beta-propeller fold protein YncE